MQPGVSWREHCTQRQPLAADSVWLLCPNSIGASPSTRPAPLLSVKVCNIDQPLEPRSGYSAVSFNNRTPSWVSDCTSFDPHDRFTLRLDSTSGSGLFFCAPDLFIPPVSWRNTRFHSLTSS